jgi:DNA-binding SARP family transcriptional activator
MSSLSVQLFGRLSVKSKGRVLNGLTGSKVQELFCYLLLHRGRPHPREVLASLLWGDCDTAQSKKYLRQALWQLQAGLGLPAEPAKTRMLLIDPDWAQARDTPELSIDVAVFEQAFAAVEGVAAEAMTAAQAQVLKDAALLYQGDLLEGWYQDWCLYERERLQNMHLAMLGKLMAYCEARGEIEHGITYGSRILRHDRARECTHQRLMRLHCLAGDRAAALRQYDRCATALEEELGVQPSERTTALRDQIRTGELESAGPSTVAPPRSDALISQLSEALERLRQFGTLLAGVESQVQQEMRVVERALKSVQPAARR